MIITLSTQLISIFLYFAWSLAIVDIAILMPMYIRTSKPIAKAKILHKKYTPVTLSFIAKLLALASMVVLPTLYDSSVSK